MPAQVIELASVAGVMADMCEALGIPRPVIEIGVDDIKGACRLFGLRNPASRWQGAQHSVH